MTRQEAIDILKRKMNGSIDTSYEWAEAIRMAIQALKQSERNCEGCRFTFYEKEIIEKMEDDGK